jgi:hypothetical protein
MHRPRGHCVWLVCIANALCALCDHRVQCCASKVENRCGEHQYKEWAVHVVVNTICRQR